MVLGHPAQSDTMNLSPIPLAGQLKSDNVCAWYNTTHTAVTVYNVVTFNETCVQSGDNVSNPLVLKSPNPNNRGEGSYLDNGVPAGGPQ
ncbi:hypothetical protein EDB80DRAFT_885242 [Ilyonectria destructans]|nr:hypothetical protein EDB80DRAFT_885242 [Ilyonectria destructans]